MATENSASATRELGKILVVDDTPTNITVLLEYLTKQHYTVLVARDGESALEQAQFAQPDLILLDVMMPGMDGYETCRQLKANPDLCDTPVIFMTALSDTADKVRGFDVGAVDFVTKPIQHEELLARVSTHLTLRSLQADLEAANDRLEGRVAERTAELKEALREVERLKNQLRKDNAYLQEEIKLNNNFEQIVGESGALRSVLHQVEQVAPTDTSVLILGETGTGKELIARAIHNLSPRHDRPLVVVNCAALPAALIESELFGHEKGAFTGAISRKLGRFELADGSSIFLDEVGDLPLDLQAKLLRVLQEGEFERLGSPKTLRVDVRVIAATNRDIQKAVGDGGFRADLFYRLSVFPVSLPPVRQRTGDIPLLVDHYVRKYSVKLRKKIDTIPKSVMAVLTQYDWPGNVREIANVIERAIILARGTTLELDTPLQSGVPVTAVDGHGTLEDVERDYILEILKQTGWAVEGESGAASRLGMNPSTLRSRMRKHGLKRPA